MELLTERVHMLLLFRDPSHGKQWTLLDGCVDYSIPFCSSSTFRVMQLGAMAFNG